MVFFPATSLSKSANIERVYYPVDFEPYTPAVYFAKGKDNPHFRTKLKIALQLVERALREEIPFRAVVADSLYGDDRGFRSGLRELKQPYVLALKPSHAWWHPEDVAGTLQDVAHEAGWESAERPGQWVRITRTFDQPACTNRAPWIRTAVPSSRLGRDNPIVRVAHVGGAELQTRQTCPGLVPVPGEKRHGHPEALAARLVCLLLLLVSCLSPLCEPLRRGARTIGARGSPPEQYSR